VTAYQELENRFARIGGLKEAVAVLNWDHSALMPAGGAAAREAQVSAIELVCHEMITDAAVPDLLDAADGQNELDTWQRANLGEMRRAHVNAAALPGRLVEALVKQQLACEMIWREARPANDFAAVKPALQALLDLEREAAQAKAAQLGIDVYDAMLDRWEPGAKAAEIDVLFGELIGFLPATIEEILARQDSRPAPLRPEGPFPAEAQRAVGMKLMSAIGFDFEHGRLDVSVHPFCGGTPDDVRITTRYNEADFNRALMAVLHETGHAMYERGLPAAWRRQPVGRARGLALHESQSLLVEMQACRSREFIEFVAPLLREAFGGTGPAWNAENLYQLNTRVERSLIRVDADEATYPAHVILRYRLERAMVAGDLALDDLPGAWRDGMQAMVGVVPPDDRDGCLQDIHWYSGIWGYFPTYTLGALTAAQLFAAATEADPAIRPGLARGDFAPLMAWLRANVHHRASSVPAATIVADATGGPLRTDAFRRHLQRRYLTD
jgi:carboxypeptidase Taq